MLGHSPQVPSLQLVPLSADCWPPNLIMESEAAALFFQSLHNAWDHRWRSVQRSMAEFRALLCGVAHFCHHAPTKRHWYASEQPVSLPFFSTHNIWKLTIFSYPIFSPNRNIENIDVFTHFLEIPQCLFINESTRGYNQHTNKCRKCQTGYDLCATTNSKIWLGCALLWVCVCEMCFRFSQLIVDAA